MLTVNYYDFYAPSTTPQKENYLIIYADRFGTKLAEFKLFREIKYKVAMASYSEAGGSNVKVVEYIKTLYENNDTKPGFALLIGNKDDIPGFGPPASDRPFSSLNTAQVTPKVNVGRWAVTNETELSNIIKKTIYMEQALENKTIPKYAVLMTDSTNGKILYATS
jgi:hypothetical protein